MTIAFVINQLIVGGAEQYVITKAEWLINQGHRIIVISEGGIWEEKLPIEARHYRLSGIMASPFKRSKSEYQDFLKKLSQILIDNNVDIVEGQNTWPIIHVVNSYHIHQKPFYFNVLNELSLNRNLLLQLTTKLLDKENLYYTLTAKMNTYIQKKCGCDLNPKILNIPVVSPKITNITDGNFVLSVCRMSPEKMYVKSLIIGFSKAIIKNRQLPHNLVLVGDGSLLQEVIGLAERCNKEIGERRIIIKGTVTGPDLDILFASCSVYVGMGTTLLTAAALAKPCIKCGFEESTMNYSWGFWGDTPDIDKDEIGFSSDDISSGNFRAIPYEEILMQILSDSKYQKEKGKEAYSLFKSSYSMDATMSEWMREYQRLLTEFRIDKVILLSNKIKKVTGLYLFLHNIYSFKNKLNEKINACLRYSSRSN